jgi:hypothetical protein
MPRPLEPVGQGARVALGISFFVLFAAAWAFATLGGYVSKTFSPIRSPWCRTAGCCSPSSASPTISA